MNDGDLLEVVERVRGRFYGKYRGTVTDVETGGRGRIKATVPAVLGKQKTGWCEVCLPYAGKNAGIAFLPEVGSAVYIEFEGGNVSRPILAGGRLRDGEIPAEVKPEVKVIRTAKGLQIVMDDNAGTIEIKDANKNIITLDSSGITLKRGKGKIVISDTGVNVNDGGLEVI